MQETAARANTSTAGFPGYASSWEHLSDELKRLDLLIRLQVLARRGSQPSSPVNQLKGLFITDDEIADLAGNIRNKSVDEAGEQRDQAECQALLAALAHIESEIEQRRAASYQEGTYLSLAYVADLFQLNSFEQQCLVICLAPEIDRKYEKLYAWLQDDVTRKKPSVDLLMNLLLGTVEEKLAARSVFEPQAPLLRFRLLHMDRSLHQEATPLLSRFLKLDDRIVNMLLGADGIDPRLERAASMTWPQTTWQGVNTSTETQEHVRAFVSKRFSETIDAPQRLIFYFSGPDESGKHVAAEMAASELGRALLIGDAAQMTAGSLPIVEAAWLLGRESLLQAAVLCVKRVDVLVDDQDKMLPQLSGLVEAAQTFSQLTFFFGEGPWRPVKMLPDTVFIEVDFPIPSTQARAEFWSNHLQNENIDGSHLGPLASKFRFTPRQISEAVVAARDLARWRSSEDDRITLSDVYAACRKQSHHHLASMARRIEPVYTWDDIVLPEDAMDQLRELCARVTHGSRVLGEWGFGRKLSQGKGANALFAGPSGTGKTMAAEIIASELGLDLYKIDLSGVVSKYIGETEKNLDRIFAAAENANAILFFDEADALFGKRSEVRDSHDRYANIEISYLLQKMEQYEGVAILATNLRQNLDEAFVRRLAFTVHFPFPGEADRHRIWTGIWPNETPLVADIDLGYLSRQFKLTGGNIKNIALGAAFYAAGDGGVVTMDHLLHATQREFQKMGKTLSEAELNGHTVTTQEGRAA
jgi:AAA+ superfamily predicted ATPase